MHPNARALIAPLLALALAACGSYGQVATQSEAASYTGGGAESASYEAGPAPSVQSAEVRASAPEPDPRTRPGLATQWGESRRSVVGTTRFVRADATTPYATAMLHYNDAQGAAAQVALRNGAADTYHVGIGGSAHRVDVSLVDEYGRSLPAYRADGQPYVIGQPGQRYAIRVDNHTPYRFEVVLSVDGLDVIDGREASFDKRGYVLSPGQSTLIEGFRTSQSAVAAFRFGSVADSYAAQSTGSARNVGVIGLALFAEAGVHVDLYEEALRREQADPFPGRYAVPPPGRY